MYFIVFIALISCRTEVESVCSPQAACYPAPIDVSAVANSKFNVTSTCGNPPETFCSKGDCTLMCNATDPAKMHPKQYMLDAYGLPTYWKSKNLEAPVTIQLDLPQKLILHQVVTTFEIDVPSGIYLQRSQDFGKTYSIIAYFAINCLSLFGRPQDATYKLTDVVCLKITTTDITTKTVSYFAGF